MKRMRVTFEIDIPKTTSRKDFNENILKSLQTLFGSLVYVETTDDVYYGINTILKERTSQ